jgi:uncharacterized protein
MPITLTESFRVDAPIERVWRYLIDPQQVARCLPGAEILEMESARAFRGAIKVRVGPVTASFQGKAELAEVDESQYRVRLTGSGRDAAGGNTATLRMTSTLRAVDGATEVRVESSVDLAGRLMQFGRGMVQEVSRQIFAQFAACVQSSIPMPTVERPAAPVKPVSAIPLAFRALWAFIRRAFRRGGTEGTGKS